MFNFVSHRDFYIDEKVKEEIVKMSEAYDKLCGYLRYAGSLFAEFDGKVFNKGIASKVSDKFNRDGVYLYFEYLDNNISFCFYSSDPILNRVSNRCFVSKTTFYKSRVDFEALEKEVEDRCEELKERADSLMIGLSELPERLSEARKALVLYKKAIDGLDPTVQEMVEPLNLVRFWEDFE